MEFFAPWMLLGLGAIAVPVLIHLFNRKSAKRIEWGAFIFLMDSMISRRRRMLIEDILLLATRCLLLALLSFAIARPFIQAGSRVPWIVVLPMMLLAVTFFGVSFAMWRYPKWRRILFTASLLLAGLAATSIFLERKLNLSRFGSVAQRDVVIIIDGSSSMDMKQGAETNFERARKEAEAYIKQSDRSIAFGLIVGGPVPLSLTQAPITDRRELFSILDRMEPVQGTMDIMTTLTSATIMLSLGNNPSKQIVIVGDGQAAGWYLTRPDRWKVVDALIAQLPSKPQIVWRTLPLPTSIRNVGIADIAFTRELIGTDRDVGIRVTVENTGSEAVTPDAILLDMGGTTLTNRTTGQLAPSMRHTVTFKHRFTRAGAQKVVAKILVSDDLAADNTCTHIAQIIDTLRVLIVDGNPVANPRDRSSTYLSLALRPEAIKRITAKSSATTNELRQFLVDPIVVEASAVGRRETFSDCSVVILANVSSLTTNTANKLARFVDNGGGLLIAPGASAQADFYNTWSLEDEPLLPFPLKTFVSVNETNRPSIRTASFDDDILRQFRTGSDLGTLSVDRFWLLNTEGQSARAIATFDQGEPFLAMRRLGRGSIILSTIPFDMTVSTLPARGSFLPLVHELAYRLASPSMANLNIKPTESATLLLTSGTFNKTNTTPRKVHFVSSKQKYRPTKKLVTPAPYQDDAEIGEPTEVSYTFVGSETARGTHIISGQFIQTSEGIALRLSRSLVTGVYSAKVPPSLQTVLGNIMDEEHCIPFSVRSTIDESNLSSLSQQDLLFVKNFINLVLATKAEEVHKALIGETFGKEIWRILAYVALFLLVLEIMLTRWIAIQRRTGIEENVSFDEDTPTASSGFLDELAKMRGSKTEFH
ncbi:MAG: BatA domain-containing protein [bacterium]